MMQRHFTWVTKMVIGLFLCVPPIKLIAENQSAHIASPEQYTLLLENESVLVLKMVLQPGESDRIHHHNNETVFFQRGGRLTITEAGKALTVDIPDGHVMWHSAWTHQVTNVGTTEVIAIIVEEKR